MGEKVIELKDVSWVREGKQILSDIHWEISRGEHWALLGLNGSGKTTLLNIINGYIWPTTGTVRVLGQQFGKTDLRELRKSIGWVSSSLQERIREQELAEKIVLSGKYSTIGVYDDMTDKDYDRAREIMEELDCGYLWGRKYATCSQGEKQRLLIGRGLMGSPELLILDEPTSGLDFIARDKLLASVGKLAKKDGGPTLIYVTHHIEEITDAFSHTLLLKDGSIFAKGKTAEVLTEETLQALW